MAFDVNQISESITSKLSEDTDLKVAVLYGSLVTGQEARPANDVDVAVLYDRPLTTERRLALLKRLDSCLSRPVDLVDLSVVNGVILKEILCRGRVLIKKDEQAFVQLLQRLVYNQEDVMPYYRAALRERAERFINV